MAVNPDSLAEVLPPGGASTQTLSIGNVGAGTLDFQLSEPVLILGSSVPGEYAIYGKDDLDPRIGSPVTEGAGGPDMTGYRWIDSDQPGGPVFNWVDISGMGTLIPMSGDDENTGPYPMGFDFEFYGNTFNSFRVCTNGFLSFTSVLPPYSNQPIPNAMAPGNMIAPFWDDLNFSGADRCYYLNDGDRLIVSWHDVPHYGFGGPYTFQVILYPDCGIVFQYLSMAEPTGSATVGIQNDAGSDGLQVAYNTSYIHDNLAIKISRMPQWVTISPNEGRVWHGGEMGLTVTYDAAGLASGVYEGTIGITSNDATDPLMNIPVTLIVGWTPAAYADFEPNTLNLSSRGRWVKMELGVPPEYDAGSFLPETAFLTTPGGGIVSPPEAFDVIGPDRSGLYAVMLKFNRGDVEDILPEGDSVEVMVAGELERETYLAGRDTIRCIRPKLIHPNGGEVFSCDHEARIIVSWETPANFDVDTYAVHFSADAGESWEEVVTGITTQSAIVDVPFPETEEALFRIYALKGEEIVGYDSSDDVFSISLTGAGVEDEVKPTVFMLRPNVPNPFSGTTSLQFDIPKEAHVNLSVYNVRGRKVKNLLDQVLTPGTYNIGWDGRSTYGDRVASGVYYYKIVAGGWNKTRAMVIVK
jgi:hypothetical protein